jgi:hypothetical protein
MDLGAAANVVAILLLGISIDFVYHSHASSRQSDTDLLLDSVKDVKAAFITLKMTSASCKTGKKLVADQRAALVSAERELSNAVHSLERSLGYCNIESSRLKFDELKTAREELKNSLTDTPFPGPYDAGSLKTIQDAFRVLWDQVNRIAFAISHR